jgi:hypothetical protein
VLFYPFFKPTRLSSKNVPQWSLLLRFFRISKNEKMAEITFSGLVKLTSKDVTIVCLIKPHSHAHVFGLIPAPCCSQLNHLKHALFASPVTLCLCVLTPLAHGVFFQVSLFCICPFALRISVFLVPGTSIIVTLVPPL